MTEEEEGRRLWRPEARKVISCPSGSTGSPSRCRVVLKTRSETREVTGRTGEVQDPETDRVPLGSSGGRVEGTSAVVQRQRKECRDRLENRGPVGDNEL